LKGGVELLADQSEFVKVCLPSERFFSRGIVLTPGTSDFFNQYTKDLGPQITREHGYKFLLLGSDAEAALVYLRSAASACHKQFKPGKHLQIRKVAGKV